MSHEVVKMFSTTEQVRQAPWHYEETKDRTTLFAEYPGREEAMAAAGHDFEVLEVPAMVPVKLDEVPNWATGAMGRKSEGFKGLVNGSNGKTLAFVKEGYEVIQPSVLYDLTEAILEVDDKVLYETGGTLKDGEVLWVMARVDRPFFVKGDTSPIFPYLAGSTTNDGKGSMRFSNVMTRIVCWNTWNAAERESEMSNRNFTFRHVKNASKRIEDAKRVLSGTTVEATEFEIWANELAEIPFSDKAIERFIVEFRPAPVETLVSDRVMANVEADRDMIRKLFFENDAIGDGIRNTAYGAVQVGMEFLDHKRVYKNRGTYMNRTFLKPEKLKNALVPMVREIAKVS